MLGLSGGINGKHVAVPGQADEQVLQKGRCRFRNTGNEYVAPQLFGSDIRREVGQASRLARSAQRICQVNAIGRKLMNSDRFSNALNAKLELSIFEKDNAQPVKDLSEPLSKHR